MSSSWNSQSWGAASTWASAWGSAWSHSQNATAAPVDGQLKLETSASQDACGSAVVSVKKSSKGCAVVILRDREVLERSVQQRVAVIDGVCVEVKRHTKKDLPEEEQPLGVFCAWGYRVERRASVSEEGLEAYFNNLAGKERPEGLTPKPPFKEEGLCFQLSSTGDAPFNMRPRIDEASPKHLLGGAYCPADLVEALWVAKDGLDDHWAKPPPPMGRNLLLRVARSQLFPHSGEGGKEHENRAGDKFEQLVTDSGLLEGVAKGSAFLDLCGGPGAWSQHLLEKRQDLSLRGYGFTLRSSAGSEDDWHAQEKDDWYPDLAQRTDWKALWGADNTGDLLKPRNIEHTAKALAKERVALVVADGGFSDDAIPANQLELYFYRLFLGEILMAASCLQPGGRFVCKLYSTFSDATASLLFLVTRVFESVSILKPMSSRVSGPERYLVAFGFKTGPETEQICMALRKSHELCGGSSPLTTPLLTPVVDPACLAQDSAFKGSIQTMTTALCRRQTKALCAMVDRAEFLEEVAMGCTAPDDYVEDLKAAYAQPVIRGDRENRDPNREDKRHGRADRENRDPTREDKRSRRKGDAADRENRGYTKHKHANRDNARAPRHSVDRGYVEPPCFHFNFNAGAPVFVPPQASWGGMQ